MNGSKEYLKENDIMPYISFKDGQAHTVKLLSDKADKIKDKDGEEKEGMKYMVIEDGTEKSFFTSAISLIQKLADKEEGSEVVIQMKSAKGADGQWKSFYEVKSAGTEEEPPMEYEG